ncbi:fumarylacetoacetate hydrolase family protein [Desulfotignum balticum]|uniref:fumarylacetoacetate hydrolase family protein n=1 Tax=Desulfotignum balticum TaxID=115781 RepID=UPI000462A185|nr:fumarylacetoacetate hydrolase family protein [Desulfotignum balticum]
MQIIRFRTADNQLYTGCDYDGTTASVVAGDVFGKLTDTGERKNVAKLEAPVVPAAIFCIGLNYRGHAKETGMDLPRYPVVFMKNPGAVTPHKSDIVIPFSCLETPEVDYEAELGVVIGREAKNVSEARALDYVLGYTCANDVSARRWQKHAGGGQWVRGKSFDTFCPLGPVLVTADEISDPQTLAIESVLNGTTMQQSNTRDMIFSVARLIAFLSESTTLAPGTLILTGTPEGVGYARKPPVYLMPGDHLQTRIQGIGMLENPVTAEKSEN